MVAVANGGGIVQAGGQPARAFVLVDALSGLPVIEPVGDVYRAASDGVGVVFPTPTTAADVWAEIVGSATRTVGVRRIVVSGATEASPEYVSLQVRKRAASTGGTAVAISCIPLDSAAPAATAVVRGFSVSPAPGTDVGAIETQRVLVEDTTAVAGAVPPCVVFDFVSPQSPHGAILRGASEALALQWGANTSAAVTVALTIEFVEFDEE